MLPEILNNTKSFAEVKSLTQRFFSINAQTKVVNKTLYLNKDNKYNIKENLDTNKLKISKSDKVINSVKPIKNNNINDTIKNVKTNSKNQLVNNKNVGTTNSGKKINNRTMTKIKNPTQKRLDKEVKATKMKKNMQEKTSKKISRKIKKANENKYFTRQLEEIKIEELLLANETQISIVSGPSSCGKTKLIQNALQTLDIDYVILESNDFKNIKTLYNTLKYQISPSMGKKTSRNDIINNEAILDLLNSIPEEIPVIIDDAYSLFNYSNGLDNDEDDNDEYSLKINPIIFEWIYGCLENDKKLNIILVSSNPLVECWIDINIPNEIVCYCPIRDLTYDEAQDFFYSYLYDEGIESIDLTFEDIYPITGTRLSIIKDFIQEYIKRPNEDFNDLDFSTLNEIYNKLNNLLEDSEQPQLLKRIMAIMVGESERGYVEEKELEYIFNNNQGFNEEDEEDEEEYLLKKNNGKRRIKKSSKQSIPSSKDFWEIIATLIENNILNRNIMEFTSPEPLPSSTSSRKYTQNNNKPVIIKRPVLFPENQCVLYAMDLILKDNNIQISH
ncbi:hypothetical protein BCR32DRAFT_263760 [Anaeromyces robustus]|uniref:Uncharacterized protein n=1 Tax=Anaeromyces robustus TaxID=1754192 RepID=A0A1Y1XS18_9FUNG|nr:hypothetical protein BCR32DRAFT_263760 [Anaeromyces robustus]|eukprot:ORX88084.1 hypothetical protein BCR32DRAFT_263760 [Anaeromyces robustus]